MARTNGRSVKKPRQTMKKRRITAKPRKSKVSLFKERRQTVEVKSFDITQNAGVLPAAGVWTAPALLNPIPAGTNPNQRVGRRYTLNSIQYRVSLQPQGATPARILVVYDRSPNGVAPTVVQILQSDDYNSPMALTSGDRFLVVSDKTYVPGVDGNIVLHAKDYKKVLLDTVCSGQGGAILDIAEGAVWIMVSQPVNALVGNFQGIFRTRYTDA